MKLNLKENSVKTLIITILCLLVLIIFTADRQSLIVANAVGFITTPMQKLSASTTEKVTEFLNVNGLTRDELENEYYRIYEENRNLKQQLVDYEKVKKENESYKKILEIKEEEPDISYLDAIIVGRDRTDVVFGFSIDKGYLAGMSEGEPIITDQGLVGIVTEVYATSSQVTTILSEDLKVSAFSKTFEESGVISSDIIYAGNGIVKMSLGNDTKVQPGTIITTSGAGGIYPKDLVIGYVKEVLPSEYDISKYAVVQPYEDIKNVKNVVVIVGFPGKDAETPEVNLDDEPNNVLEDAEDDR